MRRNQHNPRPGRLARQPTAGAIARSSGKRLSTTKRFRTKHLHNLLRNQQLPFSPPEDWYEPVGRGGRYRMIVQEPGPGFRHVVTPDEVRERLNRLPSDFLRPLEVVQFSHLTHKKKSFPCYGMQWGPSLYLYPIETNLVEHFSAPPRPNQLTEAKMYGGRWEQASATSWSLTWTEEAIKDFYLNNILIHELGHLLDTRNSRPIDRERYAEWFAIHYGYLPTRRDRQTRPNVQRHG